MGGAGSHSGFKIKLDVRKCGGSVAEVQMPPGITFAYGLSKVDKWNKGKTRVEGLKGDQAGI